MKTKNILSVIAIVGTFIIGVFSIQFYLSHQHNLSKPKESSAKTYLREQVISDRLGKVIPGKSYETINFKPEDSLTNIGNWVIKNQKLSTTGVYAPIAGIYSIEDETPKIYYPESKITFNISENEVNQIYSGMHFKYEVLANSTIKNTASVKDISTIPVDSSTSIAQYKVTSSTLDQDHLDLHKVKFGQHVNVKLLSNNLLLPQKDIHNDQTITVRIKNTWKKVHVTILDYINNNAVIKSTDQLHAGLEIKN